MIKHIYKSIVPENHRNNLRNGIQKAMSYFNFGSTYHCNCCERNFGHFLPKGNVRRENAQCPYCGSLERSRVLDFYLDKELNIYGQSQMKILHFAPEACLKKKLSLLDATYIDGDINPALADHLIDITNISYPENYFDLIICSHVLGHIPDEQKAIRELQRVLKQDGRALIMTVIDLNRIDTYEDKNATTPAVKLKAYGEDDLVRLHGKDFVDRLERAGFKVDPIDYRLTFTEVDQEKFRLGNGAREMIFSCTK